jgi:hypothetical protein
MILPWIFPASLGIVGWDDGARIERPISPDYRVFSERYVRWRQGTASVEAPTSMIGSEAKYCIGGKQDIFSFIGKVSSMRPEYSSGG